MATAPELLVPPHYVNPAYLARQVYPRWLYPIHVQIMIREIVRTIQEPNGRLIIEAPPRHSKSETTSNLTPSWYLGTQPSKRVILTSYEADFAAGWGRKVRDVMLNYGPALYGVRPREDSSAVNRWEIEQYDEGNGLWTPSGGSMVTSGVGGPITGRGADLFIIDDPIKNAEEAMSLRMRQKVWDWWQSTASTRLEPNGSVIIIMCMTGDTPVLMADGTERPLAEVRPGDQVATYENGQITSSKVLNWANQGSDKVYEVRMKSGRKVRANARHPFRVIQENGEATWVRVGSLRAGMKVRSVEVPTRCRSCEQLSSTWSVGSDEIVEIVEAGEEDVFDIEVERTHNFIANGLEVSNTRWHEDDLVGRIEREMLEDEGSDKWKIISFPAIYQDIPEDDIKHEIRKRFPELLIEDFRKPGQALWPERFDENDLRNRMRRSGSFWWSAMYQQIPRPPEGLGTFRREWFEYVDEAPAEPFAKVRFWDLAATKPKDPSHDPDYTAGCLMSRTSESTYIEDVYSWRETPQATEAKIVATANEDGKQVAIRFEVEPGSSGVALIDHYKRLLYGWDVRGERSTGSKEIRANPLAAEAEAGRLKLVRGGWNRGFVDQAVAFPYSQHDDEVDAASGAFQYLATAEPADVIPWTVDRSSPWRI